MVAAITRNYWLLLTPTWADRAVREVRGGVFGAFGPARQDALQLLRGSMRRFAVCGAVVALAAVGAGCAPSAGGPQPVFAMQIAGITDSFPAHREETMNVGV